jgi:hypothetical protein
MNEKYICPCGLICTDCLFYKPEVYETAKKLKEAIRESQLDVFLTSISKSESLRFIATHLNAKQPDFEKHFESLNNFDSFMKTLEGLTNLQCKATCRESGGCSVGGDLHKCEAVKCVQSKGLEGCWECPEREECPKLHFVKMVYGDTISETFSTMRTKGSQTVKSYGSKYYAWQRNNDTE